MNVQETISNYTTLLVLAIKYAEAHPPQGSRWKLMRVYWDHECGNFQADWEEYVCGDHDYTSTVIQLSDIEEQS